MVKSKRLQLLIVSFVIIKLSCLVQGQKPPIFRVVAPTVVCDKDKTNAAENSPESITINFQPKDGLILTYGLRIFFENIGDDHSQKHGMEIWRAIRNLERKVNILDKKLITDSNLLKINKTELISGVSYTFEITGESKNPKNPRKSVKNVIIKFSNGVLQRDENSKEHVEGNFLLFGSERTYANIEYILKVKLTFCKPRFDFYFKWNISGLPTELLKFTQSSSSTLKIPANTFQGGEFHQMEVAAIQSTNSEIIIEDYIFVEVLQRGFDILIIPTRATAGVRKPVVIAVFIQNYDNLRTKPQISWECETVNREPCTEFSNDTTEERINVTFSKPGKYFIIANVKLNNAVKSETTELEIRSNLIINWNIERITSNRISSNQDFHLDLIVHDLVPKCTGEWIAFDKDPDEANESDENDQSSFTFGSFIIKDLEQNFLSEIADFENSTVSKQFNLVIPHPDFTIREKEKITGDREYIFRLETRCSGFYNENNENIETNESGNDVGYFEFLISTNNPPIGKPLNVSPTNGQALRTIFQFSTSSAVDSVLDSPLKYNFKTRFLDFDYLVGEFYETKAEDSQLPFSEKLAQTLYEVCDNHGACSTIMGPMINITLPITYSDEEYKLKEIEIENLFSRMDFQAGNQMILACAKTFIKFPDQMFYKRFQKFSENLLTKEIGRQLEIPSNKFYQSREDIIEFVRETQRNLKEIGAQGSQVVAQLLDIFDSADDKEDNDEQKESYEISFRRRKRQLDPTDDNSRSYIDVSYVYTYLQLVENVLRTVNETIKRNEEGRFMRKLHQIAANLCSNVKTLNTDIESSLVNITLKKLFGYQILSQKFAFSKDNNDGCYVITSKTVKRNSKYCVVGVNYPKDYLNDDSEIETYNVLLFEQQSNGKFKKLLIDLDNILNTITLYLPAQGLSECLIWSVNSWIVKDCERLNFDGGFQACRCRRTGYMRLKRFPIVSTILPLMTFPMHPDLFEASTKPPIINEPATTTTLKTPPIVTVKMFKNTLPVESTISFIQTSARIINRPPSDTPTKSTIKVSPPDLTVVTAPTTKLTKTTEQPEQNIQTASIVRYTIPSVLLIIMALVIATFIFFRRRQQNQRIRNADLNVMTRDVRPGIKYARFYDEHLMIGNFNF